jgi:GNAT superfamily N-acetyltransferase
MSPSRPALTAEPPVDGAAIRAFRHDPRCDRRPIARDEDHAVIREIHDSDLHELARLVRELLPTQVLSEHTLDHMRKSTTWWVAEEAGALVGAARAGRFGRCWVGVLPEARRRGLGTRLAHLVEGHLGELGHGEAVAWSDGGEGEAFALGRGFRTERTKPVSVLRLEEGSNAPVVLPDGVAIVPIVQLDDRLRELHALTMAAYADVPDGLRDAGQSFEEWLRDDLGMPELDYEGSVVAVAGDRLAALSLVTTDGSGRAENEFTGTHPDFRGRGLATLVKRSTIGWCRAHGIQELWTGNDSENAPMLAVNRKLGYVPAHVRFMHVKSLG